jgi:hypothetical protein
MKPNAGSGRKTGHPHREGLTFQWIWSQADTLDPVTALNRIRLVESDQPGQVNTSPLMS